MTQQAQRVDAAVYYRRDAYGSRVVVLPATCRHDHDLRRVGYRARESAGLLRVLCMACAADGAPDPAWLLASTQPVANVAELDNAPYGHLVSRDAS